MQDEDRTPVTILRLVTTAALWGTSDHIIARFIDNFWMSFTWLLGAALIFAGIIAVGDICSDTRACFLLSCLTILITGVVYLV